MPLPSVLKIINNLQHMCIFFRGEAAAEDSWADFWIPHDLSSAAASGADEHPGVWREQVVEKENTKPITKHHRVCHLGDEDDSMCITRWKYHSWTQDGGWDVS